MVAQEAIDILPDETAGQLEGRLATLGARLSVQVIEQIAAGTERGAKQDATQAPKAPKLTKEHGVIDWSRPARDVVNHIRAMQPWPTAYTYFKRIDQAPARLIVYKARVQEGGDSSDAAPGQIIVGPVESGRLVVATGQGSAVEILELQPAGKRRMASAEFLRGHRPHPGDSFGPESP
jgi:methionyl-tRNA formyltransferase